MGCFAGQKPDVMSWRQVYEWTATNDVSSFVYTIDNSSTTTAFTRILYQIVYDKYSVWCEFDDFTTSTPSRVGIPLTWTYDVAVTNLIVYFNGNASAFPGTLSASISSRTAATGRINFWPSDYAQSVDGIYDDVDTGYSTVNGYGSFQVFDTTTTPHYCIFAWNNWGSGSDDLGIGQHNTGNPDWTFTNNRSSFTKVLGRIYVK